MQGLPFESATQWIALALTLLAGWLLGLATRSGKGKWRERYQDLDLRYAKYREERDAELREAERRIRDLEADNARLSRAAPATAAAPHATGPSVFDPEPGHDGRR